MSLAPSIIQNNDVKKNKINLDFKINRNWM